MAGLLVVSERIGPMIISLSGMVYVSTLGKTFMSTFNWMNMFVIFSSKHYICVDN